MRTPSKRRSGKQGSRQHKGSSSGFQFRDRTGKVHGSSRSHPGGRDDERSHEPERTGARGKKRAHEPRESTRPERGHGQAKKHGRPARERQQPARSERSARHERPHREHREHAGALKLKATVDKNRKGFGFLIFENRDYEDAFVPPRMAESLFHGDRVEVTIDEEGEVQNLRVLEHRFRELVGRFVPQPAGARTRGGWVVYERKRAREEIFIPEVSEPVDPQDWIRAKLHFHQKGPFAVTAEITEVYGPELPPSADIGMVAAEYNLIEEHSEAADEEARGFVLDWDERERTDLRHVPFITIDGETARDFDDAVYVEESERGFALWVAIADVSHYVKPGTPLNEEALSRGTSVYFPERAFHMLPRALSENLCSLRPKEPRLAMVARIEFNHKGQRTRTELMEAVIESRRRATYNEIQDEWLANKKDPSWDYAAHFALYQILRKVRSGRGSIDFDLPEAEVRVDETGDPTSISLRSRLDAHRLIEEFMIAANEAVTGWIMERRWPFIYRVHEEPAEQSLLRFQELAATVGISVSLSGDNIAETLSDLVSRLEGHPAQALLNVALLRSMKQAVYSSLHGGHFGLASPAYTHFTSPIRRYPDLVVHRMLRRALRVEHHKEHKPGRNELERLERELEEIAEHCSYRERIATNAERESIKLKQVRMMTKHLGDEFAGKVIGMVESGFFVEIREPYVEGLVSVESMTDDFYQFNEERMVIVGKRKRRTFQIGDEVKVRCLRADIDRRQIDFGLVDLTASAERPVVARHPGRKSRRYR